LTNWVEVTGGSFTGQCVIEVEPGTASSEKILCTFDSGSGNITIVQRNYDNGTFNVSSGTHAAGATFLLVASATEFAETNAAVQALLPVLQGTNTSTTPGLVGIDVSPNAGASKVAVGVDHTHNLQSSALNTWLTTLASGTLSSTLSVSATQVSAGTLPSGVQLPYSQLTGTPTLASSAAGTGTAQTISTTYPTTAGSGLLTTGVLNPSGTFANYSWEAFATVNGVPGANIAAFAILMYRVAGSGSAWTQSTPLPAGYLANGVGYNRLVASGVLPTPSSGVDYEFQLGFTVASSSFSMQQFALKVIGTN
jgi:hypothetical protein